MYDIFIIATGFLCVFFSVLFLFVAFKFYKATTYVGHVGLFPFESVFRRELTIYHLTKKDNPFFFYLAFVLFLIAGIASLLLGIGTFMSGI